MSSNFENYIIITQYFFLFPFRFRITKSLSLLLHVHYVHQGQMGKSKYPRRICQRISSPSSRRICQLFAYYIFRLEYDEKSFF